MKEIYWLGVCFNLIIIIRAFIDGEFVDIMEANFEITNNHKIVLLLSCFLSWLIPIYLIFKKK